MVFPYMFNHYVFQAWHHYMDTRARRTYIMVCGHILSKFTRLTFNRNHLPWRKHTTKRWRTTTWPVSVHLFAESIAKYVLWGKKMKINTRHEWRSIIGAFGCSINSLFTAPHRPVLSRSKTTKKTWFYNKKYIDIFCFNTEIGLVCVCVILSWRLDDEERWKSLSEHPIDFFFSHWLCLVCDPL